MFIVQENVVTQTSVGQLVKTQTNCIQQKNIKNLKSQTLFHNAALGKVDHSLIFASKCRSIKKYPSVLPGPLGKHHIMNITIGGMC